MQRAQALNFVFLEKKQVGNYWQIQAECNKLQYVSVVYNWNLTCLIKCNARYRNLQHTRCECRGFLVYKSLTMQTLNSKLSIYVINVKIKHLPKIDTLTSFQTQSRRGSTCWRSECWKDIYWSALEQVWSRCLMRLLHCWWIDNVNSIKTKKIIIINNNWTEHFNPLDARRRYTDFAQTSTRAGLWYTVRTPCYRTRRQTVYLRYGV